MGKDFFSFFQSSPDLLMCVMLPATGKQKDRRKICYTFISEMRQKITELVCLIVLCSFNMFTFSALGRTQRRFVREEVAAAAVALL